MIKYIKYQSSLKYSICILILTILLGCEDKNGEKIPDCPMFDLIPTSPYDDPVWHPSGDIIGFNHIPIKEIEYTYGYDCPSQARYIYKEDSAGFWLINADGTNKRRVLPYKLHTPAWSPDGKWIAFVQGAQIFKMPFDGQQFDTTAIEQLTFEGRNFFPAWSPDGEWIAYDNTICGSATEAPPMNSCGILIMDKNGANKKLIASGRMPDWLSQDSILYIGLRNELYKISFHDSTILKITDFNDNNLYATDNRYPSFSFSLQKIAFISDNIEVKNGINIYLIDRNGDNLQQIGYEALSFSWSPEGKIVYVRYDYSRIDEIKGTLWVMEKDGTNHKQLTFNHFIISQ